MSLLSSLRLHLFGPPPELSCLVKGVIRSMDEQPDEWSSVGFYSAIRSNIEVSVGISDKSGNVGLRSISPHEHGPIKEALRRLYDGRYGRYMKRLRAKQDPSISHFESLGCPK